MAYLSRSVSALSLNALRERFSYSNFINPLIVVSLFSSLISQRLVVVQTISFGHRPNH